VPEIGSGLFLGEALDAAGRRSGERIVYQTRWLTTHGVIAGMTGSGKTGLGIVMLEEVLAAGIPALILDPKGDLGNLLLCFPALDAADFRPWIDEGEARRQDMTPEQYAAATANAWREGLAAWGIGPERMRALREGVDWTVYTPGSGAGMPLDLAGALAPPPGGLDADPEAARESIESFVSGLLTLAGRDADPLASPEHVLLSNLIEAAWREGRPLDLPGLIGQVQTPPLRKLGVFELDAFCPPAQRMQLAVRLNALVASPSFAGWLQGEPLDAARLLFGADPRRPRAAIVYLAHLSDAERMFAVTLILSRLIAWMRAQPGTSELRALVYMDEVFGFAPPSGEPPSKKPILTILKQARAHGVGMLLATQNPVDLDYKAMSNAATWLIGRLQTERDKARILEGLASAAGGVDVAALDRAIGGLGKRRFLLHSQHLPRPVLFETRWAMSYLRGALTRDEVGRLMQGRTARGPAAAPSAGARAPARDLAADESPVAPRTAPGVRVAYLDPGAPWAREAGAAAGARGPLEAGIAARVRTHFDDVRAGVAHDSAWEAVYFPLDERFDPARGAAVDYDPRDLRSEPPPGTTWRLPRAPIDQPSFFKELSGALQEHLLRTQALSLWRNSELDLYSRPGEGRDAFEARCERAADECADADAAKLTERQRARIERVRAALSSAERRVRELEVDVSTRQQGELLSGAGALLSLLLGGRRGARGLAGIASRRSQVRRTQERLQSAQEAASGREREIEALEQELERELAEIDARWSAAARASEPLKVRLERGDIVVEEVVLFWAARA
jgi:hypothetical protein